MHVLRFSCFCFLAFFAFANTQAQPGGGRDSLLLKQLPDEVRQKYLHIDLFQNGWARVMDPQCRFGIIDGSGKAIIPCIYDSLEHTKGRLIKATLGASTLYWLQHQNVLISLQYEGIRLVRDSFIAVSTMGKCGVITAKGEGLILMRFDELQPIGKRYWLARNEGKYGLLDERGRELLPTAYDDLRLWRDRLFIVRQNQKYFLTDPSRKILSDSAGYSAVAQEHSSEYDYLPVQKGGLWGLLDLQGKEVVAPTYAQWLHFGGKLNLALKDSVWLLMNNEANALNDQRIAQWKRCGERLAVQASVGGKWALLDPQGKVLLGFDYQDCDCSNPYGMTLLQNGDRQWGLFGADGTWILKPEYQALLPLSAQNTALKKNDEWVIYDINTQKQTRRAYTNMQPLSEEYCAVQQGTLWGISGTDGREWIAPRYSQVLSCRDGLFRVRRGEIEERVNREGRVAACRN